MLGSSLKRSAERCKSRINPERKEAEAIEARSSREGPTPALASVAASVLLLILFSHSYGSEEDFTPARTLLIF
jgi:hypothetical protein